MPTKESPLTAIGPIIHRNLSKLSKPGVLTVRPGYELCDHRLTGKPAIVVTVHTKKDPPRGEKLPERLEGVPVDVREATPYQRLRAGDPESAAVALTYGRQEMREPAWPGELEMPSGKPLASRQPPVHVALQAHAHKPQVPYSPAADTPLDPVQGAITITAGVSPDCGLELLDKFLAGTQSSLVVAMYDFTSGGILGTFEKVLDRRNLQMVLDNPSLNPTANQSDPETVDALQQDLGNRFCFAWALERGDLACPGVDFPFRVSHQSDRP